MVYLDETDDIAACQDRRARKVERALIWSLVVMSSLYFWSALATWCFQ
ncbi:hypothetical protein M8997_003870 [Phyllobacterium sp. 21LDTY02-6]|nr:hypothetical protein [Phyllobacterium sp. 21LDTY02-6]MCO4316310.1 hypothetical protein [Phyllobacterium sp. 21LDTY02-6]